MSKYRVMAWKSMLRPPAPDEEPPMVPHVPLKALACRNSVVSLVALVTADEPTPRVRLVFSDLLRDAASIPASAISTSLVGTIYDQELGRVCDPLLSAAEFDIDKSAAIYATVAVPANAKPGVYVGTVSLQLDGAELASNDVELEVANVLLPDVRNWNFFLNVWMNPASVARMHNVKLWSDEHFAALRPYIEDLAAHGQKTVVAPICYRPWSAWTRDAYPNLIEWTRRGDDYEFDFSVFDRYVDLHIECGIDKAIHCYSVVQGPDNTDISTIEYTDAETGERKLVQTHVGDEEYARAWSAFLGEFAAHLRQRGWMAKAHLALSAKSGKVMQDLAEFLAEHANDFRIAVGSSSGGEVYESADDLCIQVSFDSRGVADTAPPARSAMGIAELLDPTNVNAISRKDPSKSSTTFYVCCDPEHPNTFVRSPLVESRVLPFLVLQGGFDGFVRWAYCDWSDDPFGSPRWGSWPTGDTFLVYPGDKGPISSLRWEQLREGIQDYELAIIASENIQTPEEMVDYEQAISLACRDISGGVKSTGDIEIARRLLIPIAEHEEELPES